MNTKTELNKVIVNLGKILTKLDQEGADMRDGSVYAMILDEMKRIRETLENAS